MFSWTPSVDWCASGVTNETRDLMTWVEWARVLFITNTNLSLFTKHTKNLAYLNVPRRPSTRRTSENDTASASATANTQESAHTGRMRKTTVVGIWVHSVLLVNFVCTTNDNQSHYDDGKPKIQRHNEYASRTCSQPDKVSAIHSVYGDKLGLEFAYIFE